MMKNKKIQNTTSRTNTTFRHTKQNKENIKNTILNNNMQIQKHENTNKKKFGNNTN
jgi:hypothetical protein